MKKLIALLLISCATSALGQSITPGGGGGAGGGGSGTVTSVATSCQATGGTITTSGTIFTAEVPRVISAANGPVLVADCGGLVDFTQATNDAPTIPGPTDPGIFNGWFTELCNISANTKTLTPTSGTIGGAASKVLNAASALAPQCMRIVADVPNNNWIINAGIVPASPTIVAGSTPTSGITSGNFMSVTSGLVQDSLVPVSSVVSTSANNTFTGNNIFSVPQTASGAGAASTASWLFSGIPATGFTGTTTFPAVLIQPSNATPPTNWSTTGTALGVVCHTGTGELIDLHNDTTSLFSVACGSGQVSMAGSLTVSGSTFQTGAATQILWGGRGILTSPAAGTVQFGAADAAAASVVAQIVQAQSVATGQTNGSGQNATFNGSASTGSGTSGDLIFQTGGTGAAATTKNSEVAALTIKGATQLVQLPAITSDVTHTDASVCEDTTTHALYSGSGTLGICLGTSSARYKNNIVDLSDGLPQVMALQPKNFFYNSDHGDNGAREQYGFLAEDVAKVLPKLTALDAESRPNSVDILGMVPILVKAMQEQQAKIEALEGRLSAFERHDSIVTPASVR